LGFKIGKPVPFKLIERYYLKATSQHATATRRACPMRHIENHLFKAFMILDNDENIQ
jgi:hypothetical protein